MISEPLYNMLRKIWNNTQKHTKLATVGLVRDKNSSEDSI